MLDFSVPRVMGILNITPDSFSDGGNFLRPDKARQQAAQMQADGADILDIGGESTRPGATPVGAQEELDRVIPVIEAIRAESAIPISIDTSKPEVMRAAVAAGANLVNDVCALQATGAVEAVAELGVPCCLMHMQGEPRSMQVAPSYTNVVEEVLHFLQQRVQACEAAGIARDKIWLDPGFGFGKSLQHNLLLLKNIKKFVDTGFPVLIGVSRKSMFGALLDLPTEQRLLPSVLAGVMAVQQGAQILRVHDVKETVLALSLVRAVNEVQE